MEFIVVIPARMASSRLPGKPLVDIAGKSLILRTYEQCIKAISPSLVYVATDDEKIKNHCEALGIQVVMTSVNCLTGTDRVAEVATKIKADFYINVQGDEPLINPQDIKDTLETCRKYPGQVVNGYCEVDTAEMYNSLSIPKVVFRPDGRLLYMSRAPIPGNKKSIFVKGWRQVCVYGFPMQALMAFANQNAKTPLEEQEDIEILRFLELGYEVRMIPLSKDSIAVDTPEDIIKVLEKIVKLPYK